MKMQTCYMRTSINIENLSCCVCLAAVCHGTQVEKHTGLGNQNMSFVEITKRFDSTFGEFRKTCFLKAFYP